MAFGIRKNLGSLRLNAIRLDEKEKREKELLREIFEQVKEYKTEFYRRRKLACENNKGANRKEMPDAMETIYQAAFAWGSRVVRSGSRVDSPGWK